MGNVIDSTEAKLRLVQPDTSPLGTPSDDTQPAESGPAIASVSIVEAILFASDTPLPAAKIAEIADLAGAKQAKQYISTLNERYEQQEASFRIEEIAGGFQILTLPQFEPYLAKLLQVRQESRLSKAALETLAIVAYKQPILRADVEAIRGVACGEVLNRLRELNLIKIVGRAEDLGRPLLYGTTKHFLEVFGLANLNDLPKIEELTPPQE